MQQDNIEKTLLDKDSKKKRMLIRKFEDLFAGMEKAYWTPIDNVMENGEEMELCVKIRKMTVEERKEFESDYGKADRRTYAVQLIMKFMVEPEPKNEEFVWRLGDGMVKAIAFRIQELASAVTRPNDKLFFD